MPLVASKQLQQVQRSASPFHDVGLKNLIASSHISSGNRRESIRQSGGDASAALPPARKPVSRRGCTCLARGGTRNARGARAINNNIDHRFHAKWAVRATSAATTTVVAATTTAAASAAVTTTGIAISTAAAAEAAMAKIATKTIAIATAPSTNAAYYSHFFHPLSAGSLGQTLRRFWAVTTSRRPAQ